MNSTNSNDAKIPFERKRMGVLAAHPMLLMMLILLLLIRDNACLEKKWSKMKALLM
jgi:hypothetical protein